MERQVEDLSFARALKAAESRTILEMSEKGMVELKFHQGQQINLGCQKA